jgi:hypothetical protein
MGVALSHPHIAIEEDVVFRLSSILLSFLMIFHGIVFAQESSSTQELVGEHLGPIIETGKTETATVEQAKMPVIEVKGDWIYVDGEKYFIKGIGYSGWRPYQLPWQERPDPKLMENDFRLISEAGFNTIRTWSALNAQELALARKYGLMVMQGIFVDPTRDFASPIYQNYVLTTIKNQVRFYLQEPNVLMFLVANEPPVERVRTSGVQNTEKVLNLMVDAVHQLDPKRLVTFSNWVQLAFISSAMLPVVAFNVYMYEPHIVTHALTYKGYVEWLKKNKSLDKPLVITELGLSVSSYGPGKLGRGGNTEEEQRDGTIMMYDDIINAGAVGGCIFEWNDEWWKNYDYSGDQNKHEASDPEEWFGVIEIKDETSDKKGRPRLVYDELKKYNQALIINPKNIEFYSGKIPVEIYTTDNVKKIMYKVNDGEWTLLEKTGKCWWTGVWDSSKVADGKCTLAIQAMDEKEAILCAKQRIFWINNTPGFVPPIFKVSVKTDKEKYQCCDKMEKLILTVTVLDNKDNPVANQPVDYAFYESRFWQSLQGTKNTDEKGKVEVEYYINESGFINIGAGATLNYGEYSRKFGDVIAVEVEKIEKTVPQENTAEGVKKEAKGLGVMPETAQTPGN